jgi:hypothetical protein
MKFGRRHKIGSRWPGAMSSIQGVDVWCNAGPANLLPAVDESNRACAAWILFMARYSTKLQIAISEMRLKVGEEESLIDWRGLVCAN